MFELIYGYYNDVEEKDIYEDIEDAVADAIYRAQEFDYDFVVIKNLDDDVIVYEQFR